MSIFQTFYILFKSNAEEVEKKTRAAEKAGKDLEENLGKQNKQAEELGKSFTKIVEGLTSAVTAYVSFGAIKSGILNTAAFNTALERTSQATGQNVRSIAVYGAALEQFGGNSETFQSTLRQMTQVAAEQGRQLPPLAGFLKQINREFQGLSLNETARRGGLLGITDPAQLQLLRQTTDEYDRIIAKQNELNPTTEADTKLAAEFSKQWGFVGTAFTGVFTVISRDILPVLTGLAVHLQSLGAYMQGHSIFSEVALTGASLGFIALAGAITRFLIPAFVGLTAAALPWLAALGIIAGVGVAGVAAYDYFTGGKKGAPVSRKGSMSGGAVEFWMSQGYSRDQAAAWAAAEQSESSGNPRAYNAGHYGLYQWSEDRRSKILAGTGIDVATASVEEQRRAAAWEAEQRGDAKRVRGAGNAMAASDYITRNFERPASGAALDHESMVRSVMAAKIAIDSASSSPYSTSGATGGWGGGDKNIAVSMGDVHVHTQATDGHGVAEGLNSQILSVISNHDDGVAL